MKKEHELVVIGSGSDQSIATFTGNANPYHVRAKQGINPETKKQVLENKPFKGFQVPGTTIPAADEILQLSESFVGTHFFNLKELGITVSINDKVDEQKEGGILKELLKNYEDQTLGGLADSLKQEYKSLRATQTILKFVHKTALDEKLQHQHLMLLASVNEVITKLSINDRSFILQNIAQLCEWNGLRGSYRAPMALHMKYLPELFMACPVWYIRDSAGSNWNNTQNVSPSAAVGYFTSVLENPFFAQLYQIYNRTTRPFSEFQGHDLMPPHIAKAIPELAKQFDYLVIATPYHGVLSKEWANAKWVPNIDPYIIGFKRGCDYMTIIDRWSGTGLFPLMADMIADTVEHLKENLKFLDNFQKSFSWWYVMGNQKQTFVTSRDSIKLNSDAQKIIQAFGEGTLFELLKPASVV